MREKSSFIESFSTWYIMSTKFQFLKKFKSTNNFRLRSKWVKKIDFLKTFFKSSKKLNFSWIKLCNWTLIICRLRKSFFAFVDNNQIMTIFRFCNELIRWAYLITKNHNQSIKFKKCFKFWKIKKKTKNEYDDYFLFCCNHVKKIQTLI